MCCGKVGKACYQLLFFAVLTRPGIKFNIKTWGVCEDGRSELPFHNAIFIIFEVLSVLITGMSVVIMVLKPGY